MDGLVDLLDNDGGRALLNAGLNWYPGASASVNNGDLWGATYRNGGPGYPSFLTFSQSYTYDGVNRLSGVSDTGYSRTFHYDAFGNMWVDPNHSTGIAPLTNTPQAAGSYNAHNQLNNGSYDAAGNQIRVNGNTITYDAEGRQTMVSGLGVSENYLYDANGKRVEKTGYNGASPTIFVYDAAGQLAAEYSTAANNSPCATCYLSADHLGTPRLITDSSGIVVSRHDYLPFGEEIVANQAGRDSHWGDGSDTVNQKFTGKERDAESGLDYFGARYYGSALGRWTSPEWSGNPTPIPYGTLANPQTLNLYQYMRNNPLGGVDPDGHDKLAEAIFYLDYPYVASQIGTYEHGSTNISTNSIRFSTSFGLQEDRATHEGSEVNAARHTIWQATITSDLGPHGVEFAKKAGDAHEDNPGVDLSIRTLGGKNALASADQTIDLLNNQIGRQIGQSLPEGTAPNVIAGAVLDYFHSTGLYTAQKNADGSVSAVQTKISDATYNAAKAKLAQLDRNGKKESSQ